MRIITEQGDFLLQRSGCAQSFTCPLFFLWSHFFIFWSRWVGTGSQTYYSQVCQCEKWVIASFFPLVGGIKAFVKVCGFNFLALQVFVLLGLNSISVLTYSHRLSTVLREKFPHISFSVWLFVWLSGLLFLPLYDYSLIMARSFCSAALGLLFMPV